MDKEAGHMQLHSDAQKRSDNHVFPQDGEMGLGAVDIDRIEKVYRYENSSQVRYGCPLTVRQEARSSHHSRYTQILTGKTHTILLNDNQHSGPCTFSAQLFDQTLVSRRQ